MATTGASSPDDSDGGGSRSSSPQPALMSLDRARKHIDQPGLMAMAVGIAVLRAGVDRIREQTGDARLAFISDADSASIRDVIGDAWRKLVQSVATADAAVTAFVAPPPRPATPEPVVTARFPTFLDALASDVARAAIGAEDIRQVAITMYRDENLVFYAPARALYEEGIRWDSPEWRP